MLDVKVGDIFASSAGQPYHHNRTGYTARLDHFTIIQNEFTRRGLDRYSSLTRRNPQRGRSARKKMRRCAIVMVLLVGLAMPSMARLVTKYSLKTLIEVSDLVFVGRVRAVAPSGITTRLSYPMWQGAEFEWLFTDVDVLAEVKGVKHGQVVRVAMLSVVGTREQYGGLCNGPGILNPEVGDQYLLCLLGTTQTNTFAAVTAPYDENQSILVLDRSRPEYNFWTNAPVLPEGWPTNIDLCKDERENQAAIWSLVSEDGKIQPEGAAMLRTRYESAIKTIPSTNHIIYLQWETWKSLSGWQSDVPKGFGNVTNSAR